MSSVYPRAATTKSVDPIDQVACAERIITAREASPRASKALIVGIALQGSDDVAGFEQVWDDVEAERIAMTAVSAADCASKTAYVDALSVEAEYIDPSLFADGVVAASGSGSWAEFKAGMTAAKEL